MRKFTLSILLLFSFILLSCEKHRDPKPHPALTFEVVVLDDANQPTDALPAGSDPVFAFQITNQSDTDIEWQGYCETITQENLYDTYRITGNDAGQTSEFFVGGLKADECYDEAPNIAPGTGYYMRIPWSDSPNNSPLSPGQYMINFEIEVVVSGHYRDRQKFASNFEIF